MKKIEINDNDLLQYVYNYIDKHTYIKSPSVARHILITELNINHRHPNYYTAVKSITHRIGRMLHDIAGLEYKIEPVRMISRVMLYKKLQNGGKKNEL